MWWQRWRTVGEETIYGELPEPTLPLYCFRSSYWLCLLVPIPRLSAQERRPAPTVVAAEGPPDAPEPQPMAFSAQSSGEQSAEGESNGVSVVVEEPLSNAGQPHSVPDPLAADISGTVTDVYGDIVPGATVIFEGNDAGDRRTAVAGDNAAFKFDNLTPGTPYHITIEAKNFESWKSPTIVLVPGQYLFLKDIKLKLPDAVTSVIVYASEEHIATEQVRMEERQRVLGVIPNFYVTYDPHPVALTTKLKFRLAYKASTDPMTFVGLAFMAGIYQAADIPDYGQGAKGFGQRMGAGYADSTTDIFIGGAILPWLLHQDPRYFYQGTGTKKSRALHAVANPFVCRGDNGKRQPNYSSIGGDLASGAISNLYYPESNRGASRVIQGFLITTGVRAVNALVQEFVLRRLTPSARARQ